MSVSVIIPTYNGAKKIEGIIKALEKQTLPPIEVIVVIDGSTDNTSAVLRSLRHELTSFKIIEQENKGRAAVRNRGAAEANGDLLIFFDDDMIPLPGCIEGHLAHHTTHPGSILTGGLSEPKQKNSADILKYKAFLSDKWTGELKQSPTGSLDKNSLFITAANFSLAKKTFDELGGFDAKLRDAEDMDFAIRAYKAGIPLYFDPKVFAWHNDTISCASYIKRQRQYQKAHKELIALHPWMETEGFIHPVSKPVGIKKRIFHFFSKQHWIKAVDADILAWLPKSIRYKLYDVIVTANGVYFPEKVKLN
jgi:glycosyltransferase involved in cell wall biosynthesis